MKKLVFISFFLVFSFYLKAQISFTTIVPQQAVVVGESFQVQYIIEGEVRNENIKPPVFDNFRLVAGPNIYTGSAATVHGSRNVKNIIYTLEALRPGKYVIHGASLLLSKKTLYSNDVIVTVISSKEALKKVGKQNGIPNSNYFLSPGENPDKKIRENLFIKVQVDKKTCYIGEPVLATFKLYSCLESKSDIVKNPGFYGFSVFDMVNLTDKEIVTEKLNGKLFDVHTIRKVQLFPLRAGIFTIDPMAVRNRVEFSRSAVYKKTEQEIAEGIMGHTVETEKSDAVYFESNISTKAISINVKPLPANNKPVDYNGAVGRFYIEAAVLNEQLTKNEEGVLEVAISGTGNFIQLIAPSIKWPEGVEAFEPTIKDDFDISTSPLTGTRIFRFPFVCSVKGDNKILPIQFTYFDIDSNNYKSIASNSIPFDVIDEQRTKNIAIKKKASIAEVNKNSNRIAAGIVIGLVLIVLIYWIKKRKEIIPVVMEAQIARPSVDSILKQSADLIDADDNQFYGSIYYSLWNYLSEAFGLKGTDVSKAKLIQTAHQRGVSDEITDKLEMILSTCETCQFTSASLPEDRHAFLKISKEVIVSLEEHLF